VRVYTRYKNLPCSTDKVAQSIPHATSLDGTILVVLTGRWRYTCLRCSTVQAERALADLDTIRSTALLAPWTKSGRAYARHRCRTEPAWFPLLDPLQSRPLLARHRWSPLNAISSYLFSLLACDLSRSWRYTQSVFSVYCPFGALCLSLCPPPWHSPSLSQA
jgi:hypothetical protein